MEQAELIEALANLDDSDFYAVLGEVFKLRSPDKYQNDLIRSHYVICKASSTPVDGENGEEWGPWKLVVYAFPDDREYDHPWGDLGFTCQSGVCMTC